MDAGEEAPQVRPDRPATSTRRQVRVDDVGRNGSLRNPSEREREPVQCADPQRGLTAHRPRHLRNDAERTEQRRQEILVAVRRRQYDPPDPLGVASHDELSDRAPGVVADQRDITQVEAFEERRHQVRNAGRSEIGVAHRERVRPSGQSGVRQRNPASASPGTTWRHGAELTSKPCTKTTAARIRGRDNAPSPRPGCVPVPRYPRLTLDPVAVDPVALDSGDVRSAIVVGGTECRGEGHTRHLHTYCMYVNASVRERSLHAPNPTPVA